MIATGARLPYAQLFAGVSCWPAWRVPQRTVRWLETRFRPGGRERAALADPAAAIEWRVVALDEGREAMCRPGGHFAPVGAAVRRERGSQRCGRTLS